MGPEFTPQEHEFVHNGGNLWYVEHHPENSWNIVRWSLSGHTVLEMGIATRKAAEELLLRIVHPSSHRTRTAVHHDVTRTTERLTTLFPCLL